MFPFLAPYAKAVAALVTPLIGWGMVVVASASGPVTASEWLGLAVAGATGFGVYAVPNKERVRVKVDEDGMAYLRRLLGER